MTHALLRPRSTRSPDSTHIVSDGDTFFSAGAAGHCWRIRHGVIRLTRRDRDGEQFAGLARAGDIIGSETLAGKPHAFSAHALGAVELEPCLHLSRHELLSLVSASEQRAADALGLRQGQAEARIQRLMSLLVQPSASDDLQVAMPSLREMAEMTDLTKETISRVISRLCRIGHLIRSSRHHARVDPRYLQAQPAVTLALAA